MMKLLAKAGINRLKRLEVSILIIDGNEMNLNTAKAHRVRNNNLAFKIFFLVTLVVLWSNMSKAQENPASYAMKRANYWQNLANEIGENKTVEYNTRRTEFCKLSRNAIKWYYAALVEIEGTNKAALTFNSVLKRSAHGKTLSKEVIEGIKQSSIDLKNLLNSLNEIETSCRANGH